MNRKKIAFLITIVCLTFLSQFVYCSTHARCRKQQIPVQRRVELQKKAPALQPEKRYITFIPYKAHIEGVECSDCAKSAQELLSTIAGIKKIKITLVNDDADYAIVQFEWHKKLEEFEVRTINSALAKEGFEMTEVKAEKVVVTQVVLQQTP